MSQKFQKKTENFVCEKCGYEVEGNGYTNHCTKCLWSKHVDIFPGDRAEVCSGLMKPVLVSQKGREYMLQHRCEKCGYLKNNVVSPEDNFDEILKISKELADR